MRGTMVDGLHRRALRAVALVAASAALLCGGSSAAADDGAHAEGSAEGRTVRFLSSDREHYQLALGTTISLISDCGPGQSGPRCGGPPARWAVSGRPVNVCTIQTGRPGWLTEQEFRQVVVDAAREWSQAEVPLGVRYAGDCALGSTLLAGDGRNEVGFADWAVVSGGEAAVTDLLTTWTPPANPTVRTIVETDILIPTGFPRGVNCLRHAVVHELGHVVGLGHSTDPADILYPTINFAAPASCRSAPSAAELARLQDVYGVNRRPVADAGGRLAARPGDTIRLEGRASDPEGDEITVSWQQRAGQPVQLIGMGTPTPSFVAPAAGEYVFDLLVTDRYLHEANSRVTVTVAEGAVSAPAGLTGAVPARGYGLFVFAGGSTAALLDASGCPSSSAAFWVADGRGEFVVWIPGTAVTAANEQWFRLFPSGLPANTPVLGRCRP